MSRWCAPRRAEEKKAKGRNNASVPHLWSWPWKRFTSQENLILNAQASKEILSLILFVRQEKNLLCGARLSSFISSFSLEFLYYFISKWITMISVIGMPCSNILSFLKWFLSKVVFFFIALCWLREKCTEPHEHNSMNFQKVKQHFVRSTQTEKWRSALALVDLFAPRSTLWQDSGVGLGVTWFSPFHLELPPGNPSLLRLLQATIFLGCNRKRTRFGVRTR